jgi:hypothetical protein
MSKLIDLRLERILRETAEGLLEMRTSALDGLLEIARRNVAGVGPEELSKTRDRVLALKAIVALTEPETLERARNLGRTPTEEDLIALVGPQRVFLS